MARAPAVAQDPDGLRRPRIEPSGDAPTVIVAFGRDSRDHLRLEVAGRVDDARLEEVRAEVTRLFELAFGQAPESVS
jgi:hypothetical protein